VNQCPFRALATPERRLSSGKTAVCRKWEWAMGLLINILITFLVIVLILYLLDRLPIDGRAKQIVRIVVIIIGILYLLRYLMTAGPIL
jgi:hypothetical protein